MIRSLMRLPWFARPCTAFVLVLLQAHCAGTVARTRNGPCVSLWNEGDPFGNSSWGQKYQQLLTEVLFAPYPPPRVSAVITESTNPEAAVLIVDDAKTGEYRVVYVQARILLSRVVGVPERTVGHAVDSFEAPIDRGTVEQLVGFWTATTYAARARQGFTLNADDAEYHFGVGGISGWTLAEAPKKLLAATSDRRSCPSRLVSIVFLLSRYAVQPRDRSYILKRLREEVADSASVECECSCRK